MTQSNINTGVNSLRKIEISYFGGNRYALLPTDGRKSFYGKATVFVNHGREILKSYETPVLVRERNGGLVRLWDGWSMTTGRHIAAFCGLNKKEFLALPLAQYHFV